MNWEREGEAFDGFISIRSEGRNAAFAINDALYGHDWRFDFYKDEAGVKGRTPFHVKNTDDLIANCNILIVLISPRGFKESKDGTRFQLGEMQRLSQRIESDQPTKPIVIVASLQPSDPNDDRLSKAEALRLIARETNHPNLGHLVTALEIRDYDNPTSPAFQEDVEAIARVVRQTTGRQGVRPLLTRVPSLDEVAPPYEDGQPATQVAVVPTPSPFGEHNIDEAERAYLERMAPYWNHGVLDNKRALATSEGLHFPFALNVNCAFVPTVTAFENQGGSGTAENEPKSVFEFLLKKSRPALIVGKPGAGKSTALAMAAALFASRTDATISPAKYLSQITSSVPEGILLRGGKGFFPVTLKARELLDNWDASRPLAAQILRVIASEILREDGPLQEKIEILKARMRVQPYAILIDGLDELFDQGKIRDIMQAADDIWMDFEGESYGVKIVLTSRPSAGNVGLDVAEMIKLSPPTEEQISYFCGEFGKTRGFTEEAFRELVESKRNDSKTKATDLLATPLFLNAFCLNLANPHADFDGSQVDLLDQTFAYLFETERRGPFQASLTLSNDEIIKLLRGLAFFVLSSNLDHQWITAGGCREAFKVAARSYGLSALDEAQIQTLLNYLTDHTGVLVADHAHQQYRFPYASFGEHLAGEWTIAVGKVDEIVDGIENLNDLLKWDRPLATSFGILADEEKWAQAENIIHKLLETAACKADDFDLGRWLASIRLIMETVSQKSTAEEFGNRSPLMPIYQELGQFISEHRANWDIETWAEILKGYLSLGRRGGPKLSQIATQNLYSCLGMSFDLRNGDWVDVTEAGLPGLSISARATLSCEFMEFVRYYDAHRHKVAQSSHWDHAPKEFRLLRYQDESMRRPWEERVIDVWKELEANPAAPMSFVNWHEAVAYARWQTQRYREAGAIPKDAIVRLPTAEEWTVIARWSQNGAKFPWGNNRQDASYGNWRKTGIGAPTAAGTFPENAISGLYDFGTNLRAWSHSNSKRELEWPPVGPTNELYFGTLGGSYRSKLDRLGTKASPEHYSPIDRKKSVGIRLVLQESG